MNTYHDRYARFGAIIGILVGVAIIAIAGLFFPRPEPAVYHQQPVVVPMDTYELSENGYIGWGNENPDWCDQFINFSWARLVQIIPLIGPGREGFLVVFENTSYFK